MESYVKEVASSSKDHLTSLKFLSCLLWSYKFKLWILCNHFKFFLSILFEIWGIHVYYDWVVLISWWCLRFLLNSDINQRKTPFLKWPKGHLMKEIKSLVKLWLTVNRKSENNIAWNGEEHSNQRQQRFCAGARTKSKGIKSTLWCSRWKKRTLCI